MEIAVVVVEQAETIAEQTETIETLKVHIDDLDAVIKQAGVPLPQRRRTKERP